MGITAVGGVKIDQAGLEDGSRLRDRRRTESFCFGSSVLESCRAPGARGLRESGCGRCGWPSESFFVEALSVFGEIYKFVKELLTFDGLLPLLSKDVRRLGGVAERWRFKEVLPPTVLGLCGDEDVNRSWVTTGMHRWRRPLTLPVAEARAALYAVKHSLRACGSFGKKHVILSDSMTATLAISRGRSKHYHLRRVCQQVAALALCTGSQFFLRWIPSEMNPSDNPSRGTWAPSVPSREPKEQTVSHAPTRVAGEGRQAQHGGRRFKQEEKAKWGCGAEGGASASNHGHASSDGTSAGERKHPQKGEEGEAQSSAAEHGPLNRRAHGPAAGFRHSGLPNQVQETLGGDKAVDCEETWAVEAGGASGPGADQASGVALPRRGGPCNRAVCGSSCAVLQAGTPIARHDPAAQGEAEPGWMGQAMPASESAANPVSSGRFAGYACPEFRAARSGPLPAPHLRSVHAPQRGAPAQEDGLGEAQLQTSRVSVLVSRPPPLGGGVELEDAGVRRVLTAGLGVPPVFGGRDVQTTTTPAETSQRPHFHHQAGGRDALLDTVPARTRASTAGGAPAVPFEARRRQSRLLQQAAGPCGHSDAGAVEISELSEEIPKGWPADTNDAGASGPCEKGRRKRRQKAARRSCWPALKAGLPDPPVFIEIFSGTARLGTAVAKRTGWPVLLWDIKLGSAYDLRHLQAQHRILGWIRSGKIRGGHLGTPCQSFSRARDCPPGPPPLRSDAAPLGLPRLSPKDFDKVRVGNILMRFSARVMQQAAQQNIPFSLENPRTSRLWLCPPVLQLLRRRCTRTYVTEFCMFGMPWRKSTQFVTVGADFSALHQYRCLGAKRGLCRHSGRPHLALAGRNAQGTWLTQVAEPYPRQLCTLLAQCFYNFEVAQIAESFWKRLHQEAS